MAADTLPMLAVALETALNGYLRLDPENDVRLEPIRDKTLRLELTRPQLVLTLRPGAGGVRVLADNASDADLQDSPDVIIKATPQALLRLARGEPGAEQDVYLQGDMHTARSLQRLLAELDVDWEDLLARLVGDIPARQLARLFNGLRDQGRRTGDKIAADLSEYLRFESRALPARPEVERFLNDVDRLRTDVDRLEARLRRLQQPT